MIFFKFIEPRVKYVSNCGQELIDTDHDACDRIRDRLEEIQTIWRQLEQSKTKGAKLKEANQQQQFNRDTEKVNTYFMYLCKHLEKNVI